MIRPERLTIKAAEALQQAAALARSRGNPVVNDAHLFHVLLEQEEGIVVPLLQKTGLNVTQLRAETARELERFPQQSGAAGEPTMSREPAPVLDPAAEEAPASARRRSSRGWPSASSTATCRSRSRTNISSLSISAPSSPAPSTAANSRSG